MTRADNLIATAVIVAVLVLVMILTGAPTWAWIGCGALAWDDRGPGPLGCTSPAVQHGRVIRRYGREGNAMKYRKKPVVIDAVLWTGGNFEEVCKLLGVPTFDGEHCEPGLSVTDDGTLRVPTLEGAMTGRVGDYIIRGVAGEFYPCKPDIFAATYERADDLTLRDESA